MQLQRSVKSGGAPAPGAPLLPTPLHTIINIPLDGGLDTDVCSGDVSNAIYSLDLLTFLLTIILYTIVMLVACYTIYRACYAK